jgi:phosphoenolpyruvate carboxylase
MASSDIALDNIYRYYRDFVVGQQYRRLGGRDLTIAEWIGRFYPDRINVIPLFEDMDSMLRADAIVRRYLRDKDPAYQRVFLARSDPAMNYGLVAAVILNKIALDRLHRLSSDLGIPISPIIGVGSTPFRGNLKPENADRIMQEYPSVRTVTVQSAFKYDYPFEAVKDAVAKLERRTPGSPQPADEEEYLGIIGRYIREYQAAVASLSTVINRLAAFVPARRKRKLHIGLFGYSRSSGSLVLPRAIPFTTALYSIGLPPEILGLNALDEDDISLLKEVYVNLEADMQDALRYYDPGSGFASPDLVRAVGNLFGEVEREENHLGITKRIVSRIRHDETAGIREEIVRAATLRHNLG